MIILDILRFILIVGYDLVEDMVSDGADVPAPKVIKIRSDDFPFGEASIYEIFTFAVPEALISSQIN